MTLWVVGVQGWVGSELFKQCRQRGIEVVGTSRGEVDICDEGQVRSYAERVRPSVIVNCAAYTNVDGAEKDKVSAFAVNAKGAFHLAKVAYAVEARFLHLSTDYVFDGKGQAPYTETDPCAPLNAYGASKWEGEQNVLAACPSAGIVRTSWIFGREGSNFVSSLLQRFLREKEVKVVADQVGTLTYCPDLVDALLSLLSVPGIVHFANAGPSSRYEIAQHLLRLAKKKGWPVVCDTLVAVDSQLFPRPAARPSYSALDTTTYTSLTRKCPRHWLEAAEEWMDEVSL